MLLKSISKNILLSLMLLIVHNSNALQLQCSLLQRFKKTSGTNLVLGLGGTAVAAYCAYQIYQNFFATKISAPAGPIVQLSDQQAQSFQNVINTGMPAFDKISALSNTSEKPTVFADIYELPDGTNKTEKLQALAHYYGNGDLENSRHLQEIRARCARAKEYFSTITPDEKTVIVFDMNETLLTDYYKLYFQRIQSMLQHGTINCEKNCCMHRNRNEKPALAPVKELWDYLVSKNFTCVIITAAPEEARTAWLRFLKAAGYNIQTNQLFMISDETLQNAMQHLKNKKADNAFQILGQGKLEYRKQLTEQGHMIVGNVGDSSYDFAGGYSGHEVRLPHYL